MVESVTALGISLLKDLVFKEVLLKLGKGALEDYVKDFFKDCLKGGVESAQAKVLKKALGEALQQFLQIVEEELEFECGLFGNQIRDGYEIPIEKFIRNQEVKPLLGQAFAKDCRAIDGKKLGKIWRQYHPTAMPTEFDWERVAQQYVRGVKRIIKQSPELRGILELEIQEAIEKNTQEIAGISPDFNLKVYQEGLQERYANLNLDSLDTSVYDYREKLKVWQVFVAQNVRECQEFLPQVYEIPKEHQRRLRESNELEAEVAPEAWEQYKKVYYEQPVRSILDVVNDIWEYDSYRYLVILGDPGSGKSIFLQYLALNWARSPLDNVIELPIPLLIELRTYNRDRNSGECQDLLEFFHKGNVICRLNQYQLQEHLKAGKVLVMFDGLDEVFEPTQREKVITDIHNQASRVLLHQWDVERKLLENPRVDAVTIDYKDKQAMLRGIAYHMQAADKGLAGNLIRGDDLEKILTDYLKSIEVSNSRTVARLLIEQLRSRNFILCFLGGDSYGFVHRTFLEYFCAWEYVWQFKETQTLSIEELKTEVFGKHWQDESWHEVLRLVAGMIDAKFVGEIIDYLIEQKGETQKFLNIFLAAECLAEVRNRREIKKSTEQLLNHLKKLLKYGDYEYALATKNYEEYDLIFKIQAQAVTSIAITWKDDSNTLSWLKQRALHDTYWAVRQAAVREIARGWKDEPNTLTWLKQNAQSGNATSLRRTAIEEIAHGWKDDSDSLPILKQRALCDHDGVVRQAAVQQIARGWKDEPDTLPLLIQRVQTDDNEWVRYAAVQELARGWKDEPDTLPLLKQRVDSDEHWVVRHAAVEEIARGWKDEPWMLEFLCDRALNDPFERQAILDENPRQSALEIIIKQYPRHPQTLPLLRDRAENDSDEELREFASKKLAELGE